MAQPEQQARQEIDRLLIAAGWRVFDLAEADIHAARGVAIREFPLESGYGFADYLLYVDGKAAWLMKHKLLQVMAEREDRRMLDGRVEVDDAYLGGERQGKRGRGSENKVSFIVAVQTSDDGRPLLARMNRIAFTKEAIEGWANKALAASARITSDALNCFSGFHGNVAHYQPVVVGSGRQAVVTHPEFSRVNTVLSNLKTAISGTYHHFNFAKYADRYLAEVQYRFNRRFDLKSILVRLVRAAVLTRPRPEPVIRLAEVQG